jgi:glycosyltransferase involved in cell wall biosynthesis
MGSANHKNTALPEILFLSSYPPRECGIATYSQDLLGALNNKFQDSFALKVCALESGISGFDYPDEVKYTLDTNDVSKYIELARTINCDKNIQIVLVQHEFGFYQGAGDEAFLQLIYTLSKPVIIVFHTVLPHPDEALQRKMRYITAACAAVIVMTKDSAKILNVEYGVSEQKISVIPHGTHLVLHLSKDFLKEKYGLTGKKVLSTFGLLSSGKGIDTTLDALPEILRVNPDTVFLVIGKTHPGVVQSEGEKYRNMLEEKVEALQLQDQVRFINRYLPLPDLLEYLQLTDIYLFTSTDPNQAVSGTFSYAMSCGCPIISTSIPHAREVLREDTGILIDFKNAAQLAAGVNRLLMDEPLRIAFSESTLQRIVPTAWENSAIAHARLFQSVARHASTTHAVSQKNEKIALRYRVPEINLEHVKKMTTDFGMLQFSKINQPDPDSGFTIDDNARALISMCMHYELTADEADLHSIYTYLHFIQYCQQPDGSFLNYVDIERQFTSQNETVNLSDSNGRAIWALGYLISMRDVLPAPLVATAQKIMQLALPRVEPMHSTRAMSFAIKGLFYANITHKSAENTRVLIKLADRLVQMYRHESDPNWQWYESYLTYANSVLPEALLCAWQETGNPVYKEVAQVTFDFLLSLTFDAQEIKVISNKTWLHKGQESARHGEQPIDVAYTIMSLSRFYDVFKDARYLGQIAIAFDWFLGNNHLHQIIYNPCTGGCYDGLEETRVNLNQGAESTLSYLMARLAVKKKKYWLSHASPKAIADVAGV